MTTKPRTTQKKIPSTPPAEEPRVEEASPGVSPVSAWKKKVDAPVELPSGNTIRIRNVGFKAFMKAGIIPNSLMSTVEQAVQSGKQPDVNMLEGEDENLNDMFELIDEVTIFTWLEPQVHRLPMKGGLDGANVVDEDARQADLLYVDEIEDEDKMFVFNITTGGTRDVEQFRREQADSVASV